MNSKHIISALGIVALAVIGAPAGAQTTDPDDRPGQGVQVRGFLDEDGDGFNDLAPDADGDGIPNGLDPDYTPSGDGQGRGWVDGDRGCDRDGGLETMLRAMGEGGSGWGSGFTTDSGGGAGTGGNGGGSAGGSARGDRR
jgi:hypothetical protein